MDTDQLDLYQEPERHELPDLWEHQTAAIEALRDRLRGGAKGVVLCSPTGSGKTVVSQAMIAAAQGKGSRSLFLVDGIDLLSQTSQRFYEVGIDHGVIGAGKFHGRYRQVVVAMIQTLSRWGSDELGAFLASFDVIFVDECQVGYRRMDAALVAGDTPFVGLSATPLRRGMRKVYDGGLVQVTTPNKLIEARRIVAPVFRIAVPIDMTDAPVVNGEWEADEVQRRGRPIIGDIVSTWVAETSRAYGGPVKTMLFSASIAHGEELCQGFQAAGFDFRQVTAHDTPEARKKTMEDFRHGTFPGVVSVAALGKGIDVPDVQCLILARPLRKGFMAHMQMIGRGLRTAPGKANCLILCHSGNAQGFYDPMMDFMENGVSELDNRKFLKVTRKERKKSEITCAGCGILLAPAARTCPACGLERKRPSDIEAVPGQMITIEAISSGKRDWRGTEADLWSECCTAAARFLFRHHDEGRAHRQAKAHFYELAGRWPPREFRFVPKSSLRVSKPVQRKIDQAYRRWRKEQAQQQVAAN